MWEFAIKYSDVFSLPYPVRACAAVRLPERHSFSICHLVNIYRIGRNLYRAVALRDHSDLVSLLIRVQLCSVLNI